METFDSSNDRIKLKKKCIVRIILFVISIEVISFHADQLSEAEERND